MNGDSIAGYWTGILAMVIGLVWLLHGGHQVTSIQVLQLAFGTAVGGSVIWFLKVTGQL